MEDTFPADMSRRDRRRFKALTQRVDKIVEADRRFFERFPDRTHRLRLMSQAEREQLALAADPLPLPEGCIRVAAIKKVPGGRMRAYVIVSADADLDAPEDVCRTVYEQSVAGSEYGQEIERSMHVAFGGGAK